MAENRIDKDLRFYPPFYEQDGVIKRIFRIIDYRLVRLIVKVLGKQFISESDKKLLKEFNFDFEKEMKRIPPYQQAMIFGRLVGVLEPRQTASLGYADFYKFVSSEQVSQLTLTDQMRLGVAATKTYTYLKGLGDKMKKDVAEAILGEVASQYDNAQAEAERRVIQEAVMNGTVFNKKQTIKQIVSDIGHRTQIWEKDWLRIMETEMQNIFEEGTALSILDLHGEDALVYKTVFNGACSYCIRFFTTNGLGSRPKIFKLKELLANGTNVGRRQREWLPTVPVTHPYCRCSLQYYNPMFDEWDEKLRMFVTSPMKEEERKVRRKSKIHIKVGTKEFDV